MVPGDGIIFFFFGGGGVTVGWEVRTPIPPLDPRTFQMHQITCKHSQSGIQVGSKDMDHSNHRF